MRARATRAIHTCCADFFRYLVMGWRREIRSPDRQSRETRPCCIPTCSRSLRSMRPGMPRSAVMPITDSASCAEVRAHQDRYASDAAISDFLWKDRLLPGAVPGVVRQADHRSRGVDGVARRLHLAHFNIHVHVIGDGTARTIVDAIEAARAADGDSSTHDSIAHLQFADPDDLRRIGRDRLYGPSPIPGPLPIRTTT